MKGDKNMTPETPIELLTTPDKAERVKSWLEVIGEESLLPPIHPELIKEGLTLALTEGLSPKFVMILCPAFRNLETTPGTEGGPTREIVPFDKDCLPRLRLFAKEIAALVVGTKKTLGASPQILLIINDIFEPGVEKRIANISQATELLSEGKTVLHKLFQGVDDLNPDFWPFQFQKSIRIVLQSDFLKPLTRFGLPDHKVFVATLMKEGLDPQTEAFNHWLEFLKNTRADPLMSPKAWSTGSGALTLHERVRFLVAMYWTDGLINPLLFKTIFNPNPAKRAKEGTISPIFMSGVTRTLQAEMEMKGVNFHLGESVVNDFPQVKERDLLVARPAIHIIRNTATWTEPVTDPFTFGGRVILK